MPATLVSALPPPAVAAAPKERLPPTTAALVAHLKALHQKASRALILGQGAAAWQHSSEAVQHCNIERLTCEYGEQQARQLCCRLWILHICVLSSLAELAEEDGRLQIRRGAGDGAGGDLPGFPASVRGVWDAIMAAFGGYAGNVDSEVLVPTVLLCLKLRDARTARDIVEAWLATLSDDTMFLLQSASGPGVSGAARQQQRTMARASYLRVCELYTLHILPQLGDFPSAYEFLSVNTAVSAPARSELTRRLDSLRNPPPAAAAPKKRSRKKSAKPRPSTEGRDDDDDDDSDAHTPILGPAPPKSAAARAQPPPPSSAPARSDGRAVARKTTTTTTTTTQAALRRTRTGGAGVAWQVVRQLMSRWGFTLFTLAVAAALIRLLTQRFRLPHLLNVVYRKLRSTLKMGTKITYI
ncbi:hypothetical protein H4R18_002215 [Coemansia javaensis]|uniref:Uncharacterized protein n=1 Tax=Coemansia javaensis TaxID=2761396 RepID=A0A9W8HI88_9FUNG|nr:hypothetical protein H4R18_002215 [Coemansia javaensis]